MTLTELSVRRGVTLAMLFLIIVGFGLFSLARLRLDMYPDITFPVVGVVTTYEGAGPKEMEDLVTRPIEGAVTAVEGVKHINSTSKRGASVVIVEFNWGADIDKAEREVRKYLDFLKGIMPEDADEPIVFAFNPSMQPVAFFGLSGPYSEIKLRQIAEDKVSPLIERIPGVAAVDIMGGGKREIQVQLDPGRLAAAAIAPQQVVNALRMDNVQLPGGSFVQGGWEFNIQTEGRFTDVTQIEEVVVGMRGQVPVRLRDVARIVDGLQEPVRVVRNDNRPGIMIVIRKQSDANTVQVVRNVLKALPDVETQSGRGIRLGLIFNQADFIEQSIGNLSSSALLALLMTFLVLLFFLRSLRSSLIVAGAIPISVVATFSIMDAAGLTLNIISMAGLALAVGMLVDNAIVVLENIFTHTEMGEGARQAAIKGTNEVAMAITASTLTTLVVFLPILFVPGIAGEMFGDMAITICFSLAASLFVARTLVPLAASRLLQRRVEGTRARRGPGRISRALGRLLDGMFWVYVPTLTWVLRHRKITLIGVILVFVGVMASATQIPTEFFPKQDQSLILFQADTAVGTSLEETDKLFKRMEDIVENHVPERTAVNISVGSGEGFMALFSKGSYSGIMRLRLCPRRERTRTQQVIEQDIRRRFNEIPGVTAQVMSGNLFGSSGDIVVEIYGHDLITAKRVGADIKRIVETLEGTADVTFSMESERGEYEVRLDRRRLAALGLNTATVSSAISTLFSGKLASVYREAGTEYNIRVRGPITYRRDRRDLQALPIVTPTGQVVPLSSIAVIEPSVGPATITRKDQQRMVTVSAAVPGKDLGGVLAKLNAKLDAYPWPEEFTHGVSGQAEDFKESFMYLGIALLASILLVYMVMASQFESLLHPFLILFSIPLAFVGVVVALHVSGTSLSVTALIGVLILVGVVVNNAIVLIDAVNQFRKRGQELHEAVIDAGRRRLRPILMTSLTTILGMVPMAVELGDGSETWSPMARAVIGGMVSSTFLTLIVIPTIYVSVEETLARIRAWRERRQARKRRALAQARG